MDIVTIFVASSAVILLLAFGVVLFVLYYQRQLLKQKMKVQTLESERQSALLQAVVEGQERERKRLAKDLHDDVGALLTATKMQVNQLERQLDNPSAATTFLGLTKELLQESVSSVRQVSHGLMPASLSRFGLGTAIENFVEPFNQAQALQIEVHYTLEATRYPEDFELGVFRIVQELVNNTAKHAEAQRVSIDLQTEDQQLVLRYQDDGKGFDPALIKEGLGLKNLETRVELLGGTHEVHTQPGKGLKGEFRLPLPKPNMADE